jgi:hypothetical protein
MYNRGTRCVIKQTELPKYKQIRDSYEKIVALYICNKFCLKSFAEKSLWVSAYGIENVGLLVLPHPKNDPTSFVLSLPKPFT